MKKKNMPIVLLSALLAAVAVISVGFYFISSVRSSMWNKSATDILEVTSQGRHALDTYIDKDIESLHLLALELASTSSKDSETLQKKMRLPLEEDTTYICVDFNSSTVYTNLTETPQVIGKSELQVLASLDIGGIREPYLDSYTGVKNLAVYERFAFADGAEGLVQRAQKLESIAEKFSLSFYENTGFSYVVNSSGDVLIRTLHKNSNRTFQNIFDIIDADKNDADVIDSFKSALAARQKGVARFDYESENYVFCYVPLEDSTDWYVISIIPNAVIMKQADYIINRALLLCGLVLVGISAVSVSFFYQRKKHHREVQRLAYFDSVTGLYRYEKFLIEGESIYKKDSKLTVIYLDIVGFKLINDMEGYDYGDRMLTKIASIIKETTTADEIACRVSGDDFIVLSRRCDKDEIMEMTRQITEKCEIPDERGRFLQIRIGVCRLEDAGEIENFSGLVDRARMAQKHEEGDGNVYFYNESLRSGLLQKAEIEKIMAPALENGEFIYYIQPKYDASGEKVLGGEALVRWQRPDGSIVSPADFIPLFEHNGFIKKLDVYIFEKVCRELKERLSSGLSVVPISVNISRADLFQPNFVDSYAAIKTENNIPDNLLELELTESLMLENTDEIFGILSQLRQHGFLCSIDDFGSGYSSLNALKDLPADILKLDKKFLDESADLRKNETIIRSVIEMAKKLSLKTVAEGVERSEQVKFLKEIGCDMIQGFVFSKPIAPDSFYELLPKK